MSSLGHLYHTSNGGPQVNRVSTTWESLEEMCSLPGQTLQGGAQQPVVSHALQVILIQTKQPLYLVFFQPLMIGITWEQGRSQACFLQFT